MVLTFPSSLDDAWTRVRDWLPRLRRAWPEAQLREQRLANGTPWRWIEAPARRQATQALVLTAGLHGIEGYVGLAVLDWIIREGLADHLAVHTDLVLVPLVNPWGMAHARRVNANNVDLNRNVWPPGRAIHIENPAYDHLHAFLNPQRPVHPSDGWRFYLRALQAIARARNPAALRSASLQGQTRYPKGIFFAGTAIEPEIRALQRLLDRVAQRPRLLHIDVHTGYGPRDRLTLVAPQKEPRSLEELRRFYHYPHVDRVASSSFYQVQGDLGSYLLALGHERGLQVHTIALEFGTWGDSLMAQLRSLRALVLENQLYHFGATHTATAAWIREEFRDLFFPRRPEWRRQAAQQAHRALTSILAAFASEP